MKANICIPHQDTLRYLKGSVEQIKRYRHDDIDQHIIICDQSKPDLQAKIREMYGSDPEITLIFHKQVDSGYCFDLALERIEDTGEDDFFITLDCDAFPIHKNWLYAPLMLIKEYGFSFVGSSTGLHNAKVYQDMPFYCINNYFKVSRTSISKRISKEVGFIRVQNREKVGWENRFKPTPFDRTVDSGVIGQWYADWKQMGGKFSLVINKILGRTTKQGVFGMNIDDLVFHFVFSRADLKHPPQFANTREWLGEDYFKWYDRIKQEGITNELIDEMLGELKEQNPYTSRMISINPIQAQHMQDQPRYVEENEEVFKRLEELKNA